MFIFILATAAAEISVDLAVVLRLHLQYKSLDVKVASEMRG